MTNRALRLLLPACCSLLASAFSILVFTAPAFSQTNLETNSGVRFNFSPPGAPNLALGGAFIGLADDATAAYTNPAGLIKIVRPEVTAEIRDWEYTHVYIDRGLLDSPKTPVEHAVAAEICEHQGFPADCLEHGLIDAKAKDNVPGPSFFSLVYPRGRWALALYRHELVNFEAHFSTFGPYLHLTRAGTATGFPGAPGEIEGRLASLRNRMSLEITNYGFAAAYDLGSSFSLGVALSYYGFSLATRANRYLTLKFEDPPEFEPKFLVNSQTQAGDDGDWSGTLGVRWESRGRFLSLGGVYHRGPTFDFQTKSATERGALIPLPTIQRRGRFHVPDAWGVGLGLRPSDAFRIAVDYDHIEYSALTRDFIDIFGLFELFGQDPQLEKFRIDDADEVHVGFEYFFLDPRGFRTPLSLLAGAWHDPDHSLRFEGDNEGFRAMFRSRPDQVHYTLGLGFSARRFQAYLAYDYSERTRVLSLSAVHRFTWGREGPP